LEVSCRRCHETLREADRYCPVCGLPQLMYMAAEAPVVPLGSESVPPPLGEMAAVMNGIQWRQALRAAMIVAIPAGVLCSALSQIGSSLALFWMVGAAVWAVVLYARRSRSLRISMGNGARIGLITALLASWLTFSVDGLLLWLGRFVQHQGSQMDKDWTDLVDKVHQMDLQMAAQTGMASAQFTQQMQSQQAWMLSPAGRAGAPLVLFAIGTAFLILFATLGGALSARFLGQPRRSSARP
jgi:hypothetical protein